MKFTVAHMQACNAEKFSSKMHLRKVQMQNAVVLSCKDYGVTRRSMKEASEIVWQPLLSESCLLNFGTYRRKSVKTIIC